MAQQKKQLAYVIYPGINLLDLVGTFSVLNGLLMAGYERFTVAETLQALDSDTVLGLVPDKLFSEVPRPNILVVLGGGIATLKALGNDVLRDYVYSASNTAERVIGVSTGALLLAGLGLLAGRKATTHWMYSRVLAKFDVEYVQRRWVEHDKYITSGGGTAGIDLGLHLLAQLANEGLSRQQQLFAEYDPEPPFGGIAWDSVDRNALTPVLFRHQEELKTALEQYPEIYHKLYAAEPAVV